MTETPDTQPWAATIGAAMGDPEGLLPGYVVQFQRMEAAERADEARRAAEAQDRADARLEQMTWEARRYSAMRGLPFDVNQPFANLPSVYARADRAFALQDLEARQADLRAAKEAGLVHLLHGSPVQSPPPGPSTGPRHGTSSGDSGAATRAGLLGRIRAARARWATRSRCRCVACTGESLRADDGSRPLDDGRTVIRSIATEPRIIG